MIIRFIRSVYSMCKLCNCHCIRNIEKHSAAGCSISNLSQPNVTSYRMIFRILITSTRGLITVHIPFNKPLQQQFVILLNVWEGIIDDLFQGSPRSMDGVKKKTVLWPLRSPSLTSVDFYLWGHLKSIVYGQ
jgi:hypothetical protein